MDSFNKARYVTGTGCTNQTFSVGNGDGALLPQQSIVVVDEIGITCQKLNGSTEYVAWSDLTMVLIHTTDHGPFGNDLFWVLLGEQSGCVIPSDAEGVDDLVERLQQLPDFDNSEMILAMSFSENQDFLCWHRKPDSVIKE